MSAADQHNVEGAVFDHSGIRALTRADGENRIAIIPSERNHRMLALLVLIAVSSIFIKIKFAVSATIDAEFDRSTRILLGVLDLWSHGNDGTGAHEERHAI